MSKWTVMFFFLSSPDFFLFLSAPTSHPLSPSPVPLFRPSPAFVCLRKTVVLVTNPGNPGTAWRGFTSSSNRGRRGGRVAF